MLNKLSQILGKLCQKEPESEPNGYRLDKKSKLYLPNSFFIESRQNLSEKEAKPKELSRHPLTVVVFGFLLTGVAGTLFSNYYNDKQIERDRFFKITAARRLAIQDFARLIYHRRTRAAMLASSFLRLAPLEEVKERKRLYDDAFVDWDSRIQANLFLIRSVMESEGYSNFEYHVEFRLVPIFREIDKCLTQAYDQRLINESPQETLKSCQIRTILQHSLDCSYAITDQLFRIAAPIEPLSSDEIERRLERANTEVINSCSQ